MEKKTWAIIFKLPAQLILILMALGAVYAKMNNLYPMQWATPITIVLISVLYFIGLYWSKQESSSFPGSSKLLEKSSPSSGISLEPSKEISMPSLSSATLSMPAGIKSRVVRLS